MSLAVEIIDDAAALAGLEPDWWTLWRLCPSATPFTAPAWLIPWWDAFAPGELRGVLVRQEGRLVALAPLWLEDGEFGLRLLPIGIGISDVFDLLVDPSAPGAAAALVAGIASLGDAWCSLSLEELPADAAVGCMSFPEGWRDAAEPQGTRPVLSLDGAEALAAVPGLQRRKLRMTRNRVARRGGTLSVAEPGDAASFLADLVRLHGARWASRAEPGVLADPRVGRFHATALPRLLAAGLARCTRLLIGGEIAGAYYGLRHGRAAYGYIGGFDPAFAFESPGSWLLGEAIEAAHREGARSFDFLRGREAYKYAWGASDVPNRRRVLSRDV